MKNDNKQKIKNNKDKLKDILKEKLTEEEKAEIEKIVDKIVKDYGETLKLLAQNNN